MSWSDAWGSTPCRNAIVLAKAFYEGHERTFGKSRVEFFADDTKLCYYYNDAVIAWYTPESCIPRLVVRRLSGAYIPEMLGKQPLEFRAYHRDKGEARHLQALGVQAEWQWGRKPFLICGADAGEEGWMTLEQWAAAPKWTESVVPKKTHREPFINLTLPLFA